MKTPIRISSGACLAALLVALLCVLAGCAARQPVTDPARAAACWQAMTALSAQNAPAPFRDSMTLRFGREGNTRRVTALFWGNGDRSLRLDVRAGVGATVAMLAQQDNHFLLYAPMDNGGRAYFHEGATSPLLKLGVPLPFDLFRLEALLHGRYLDVFGASHTRALTTKDGLAFELDQGIGGTLTLTDGGLPLAWQDRAWKIAFSHDEEGRLQRLELANNRGEKGIVLVKGQERPTVPFSAEQMRLELPPDVPMLPLEDMAAR